MVELTRHRVDRHPPPPGPDDLVDRELAPHIAHGDDVVQPGVRHEDHVRLRAGRDGRQGPAGPRREQVRHVPRPRGQVQTALLLQPADAPAPAVRGPVAALGEDDQRAVLVQPAGQPLDLPGEDALAGLLAPDPHVRQPVAHDVHAGVQLQCRLHHHPRPPLVDAQQLVDQQEGVPGPGVPAEHDHRPGQPGSQFRRGGFRLVDLDPQAVGPFGTAVHQVKEPAHDSVVAALVRLGAQPAAEPAHHPEPGQHDQRRRLGDEPDQHEAHQPQAPHVAGPRPRHQPEHQGQQRKERREQQEPDREDDHQRRQHEAADQPGWEHAPLPSSEAGPVPGQRQVSSFTLDVEPPGRVVFPGPPVQRRRMKRSPRTPAGQAGRIGARGSLDALLAAGPSGPRITHGGSPSQSGCWLWRLIRSAQLQLTRMADPLSELPQDTGTCQHTHTSS